MRSAVIIFHLLPFALSFLRDRHRWLLWGPPAGRGAEFHRRRADQLVATIALPGPTFVKLAQVLGARAALVPEPYLGALGRLHDQVPPAPYDAIAREVTAACGAGPDAVFERFDREPLAAASLGQVHRARLGGEEVVVKVLRPGVEELVARDVLAASRLLAAPRYAATSTRSSMASRARRRRGGRGPCRDPRPGEAAAGHRHRARADARAPAEAPRRRDRRRAVRCAGDAAR